MPTRSRFIARQKPNCWPVKKRASKRNEANANAAAAKKTVERLCDPATGHAVALARDQPSLKVEPIAQEGTLQSLISTALLRTRRAQMGRIVIHSSRGDLSRTEEHPKITPCDRPLTG
jgi:hypothetical protein